MGGGGWERERGRIRESVWEGILDTYIDALIQGERGGEESICVKVQYNVLKFGSMERLDQGHLHPLLEVQTMSRPGIKPRPQRWEANTLAKSYSNSPVNGNSEHLHELALVGSVRKADIETDMEKVQ